MSRRTIDPVTRARKNLILRLVEEVVGLEAKGGRIDQKALEQAIDIWLPQSYAEAQAEYDAFSKASEAPPRRTTPSPLDVLRAAMGYGKEMPLADTIRGAAERVRQRDELLAAMRPLLAHVAEAERSSRLAISVGPDHLRHDMTLTRGELAAIAAAFAKAEGGES